MKRISRITVQKNNPHRFNIFLTDGKEETFGFGVDEDVLISHRLMKNQELDEGLIKKLLQEDSLQKTYAMAINYLSYRMRSEKEIKDYLMKKK
ncbi:regulatory protein RecX [Paracerasibacillus soli]|uniref:RecX first three-helical domain-containing protein n=1 Tax=Paracerasibacillus soli TaxID=480284 RepID=A0ABU5CMI0_9BACI|nr:hypothetical protein [Virgibacillus soli]MDY0407550.1 hypothetical protein [Virgibacillus soli]